MTVAAAAPQGRPKLPVVDTLSQAFTDFFNEFSELVRVGWLLVVIVAALQVASSILVPVDPTTGMPESVSNLVLLSFISFFATVILIISFVRVFLKESSQTGLPFLQFGRPERLYAGAVLSVMFILVGVIIFAGVLLFAILGIVFLLFGFEFPPWSL